MTLAQSIVNGITFIASTTCVLISVEVVFQASPKAEMAKKIVRWLSLACVFFALILEVLVGNNIPPLVAVLSVVVGQFLWEQRNTFIHHADSESKVTP